MVKAFHPSWLSSGSRDQVQQAAREWLRLIALALSQEARATAIRVGRYARELADQWCARSTATAAQQSLPFAVSTREILAPPDIVPVMATSGDHTVQEQVAQLVRQHFRTSEQFYEQGGRKALMGQLEPVAQALAQAYLDQVRTECLHVYGVWLEQACQQWRLAQLQELTEAIEAEVQSLQDPSVGTRLAQVLAVFPVTSGSISPAD